MKHAPELNCSGAWRVPESGTCIFDLIKAFQTLSTAVMFSKMTNSGIAVQVLSI